MKKIILFVIDSLGCGGAEKSLVSLLPLLNRDKYEIHLWMLHRGGEFEALLPEHIIIEPEPLYGLLERIKMRMASLCYSLTYRIKRLLGIHEHGAETFWKCVGWAYKVPNQQFDVVIAYQQGIPTYLVSTKIKSKRKIAWINVNIFNAGYNPLFNSRFYDKFDVLVPVSKNLESILKEKYPQLTNKYVCVYDILNPSIIIQQALEVNEEQTALKNGLLIVTTGRLALQKNYELAVKAAKILRDKRYDFRWLFIGDGEERSNIAALVKGYKLQDKVLLLGMKTNPYPYMKACDIYAQPSRYEGKSVTVREAQMLCKPVVVTDYPTAKSQIQDGVDGVIVPMDNEGCAQEMVDFIRNKMLQNQIVDYLKTHDYGNEGEAEKLDNLINSEA